MTLEEKELLTRFLQQLASAQAGQKDAEAEALIREAAARQPDAVYLLAQRALQLEQLLQASQAEVQKLQAEVNQPRAGASPGSFLNDPSWGVRPSAPAVQPQVAQRAAPAPTAPAAAAAPAPAAQSSWGSGLFGNIATTAAGVVAGSFLFQGIQGLMHRNDAHPPSGNTDHAAQQAQADQPELLNSPASDQQYAQAEQPELLNSYETPDDGTLLADSGDSGDLG